MYAPEAIRDVFDQAAATAPGLGLNLSGIVGDASHGYGYHLSRAMLPSSDYSVQLADDKLGDPDAASALDIKPGGTEGMRVVTRRLIDATQAGDPRMRPVREFFGTLDGRNVTGLDVVGRYWVTSDDSHLWHVHISFLRRFATDKAALAGVADVIAGRPLTTTTTTEREAQTMGTILVRKADAKNAGAMGTMNDTYEVRTQTGPQWTAIAKIRGRQAPADRAPIMYDVEADVYNNLPGAR